ncbi:MAG: hypothetical protein RIT28_2659, partial [Pseudomonadota bacterium]
PVATPADRPSATWPPASEDDEATLLARFDRDDLASTQIESMVPAAVTAATSDAWAEPVAPPEAPMSVWPPPQDEPSQEEDPPEEYDDEPEAPAPSPRNNLLIYGLVGVIVFTLVFTVGLGVLFMGPLKEALQGKGLNIPTDEASEEPAQGEPDAGEPTDPKPTEPKPAEPKVDEAPAGPHIAFRSLAEGTRKLNVNCGAASGKGAEVAYVEVAKAEKCAVTAILEKGRLQAVITDAKEGEYRCFEGGESRCVR